MSDRTPPLYLPVNDACVRYGCSRSGIYILVGQGKIAAVKRGRRTLIVVASGDAHFASLPPAQIKAPTELAANASAEA